jgi:uncharacterized protein
VSAVAREPIRSCVGCHERGPKSTLVRIVVSAQGLEIDRSGAEPGRGAYVHSNTTCVAAAGRSGVLGRALRTGLDGGEVGRLMHEIERMGAA